MTQQNSHKKNSRKTRDDFHNQAQIHEQTELFTQTAHTTQTAHNKKTKKTPDAKARPAPRKEKLASANLVVRVLPDVIKLNKTFDYAVSDRWIADGRAAQLQVGSIVRMMLGGRKVRGWVTDVGVTPPNDIALAELQHFTGMGPSTEIMELADWAAWRWAGSRVSIMRTASPSHAVRPHAGRPHAGRQSYNSQSSHHAQPSQTKRPYRAAASSHAAHLFGVSGVGSTVTVIRSHPCDEGLDLSLAAAQLGDALIVVPGFAAASRIANRLRSAGVNVAFGFKAWEQALSGATVVGNQTTVWMPMPNLAAVVVIDEHDDALQAQKAPTWNARDVALERARRKGVPAVLMSPVPSLEALKIASRVLDATEHTIKPHQYVENSKINSLNFTNYVDHGEHRDNYGESRSWPAVAWPVVAVLDRRDEDPVRGGLLSENLSYFLNRDRYPGKVVAVLNRKGRSRLMACNNCGELVRSSDGSTPMILHDKELVSKDGSEKRPAVCAKCGSTVLRNLRMGIIRACEDLAAMAGEPVGEVTSETDTMPQVRILLGTEAVLWRLNTASVVILLDFDQELLTPRQRASLQALALLARAARLLRSDQTLSDQTLSDQTASSQAASDQTMRYQTENAHYRSMNNTMLNRLVIQTRQPDHPVIRAVVQSDPSIVAKLELERRKTLNLPPFSAQAMISGAGAAEFIGTLRSINQQATTVKGPLNDRYLLQADTHEVLLNTLAKIPRPSQRMRLEVDPLHV